MVLIIYMMMFVFCLQRKHPPKIKVYNDLVAARKWTLEPEITSSKQAKISDLAVGGTQHVPQAKFDQVLIDFICEGLHPFTVVEQPAFKELVSTLNPRCKIISRPTLRATIQAASTQMKKAVVSHLSAVSYVATTTNCWTAHQRSFIGVICHWIDEETFERRSAALACQRLRGSHMFDVLAGALDDVHCQYGLRGKVVRTTTDCGSNFVKAFSVFGEQSPSTEAESDSSEEEPKVTHQDTLNILEENNGLEYQLPPHQRCTCHLLNLIATTDAAKAEEQNDTYKRLSRAAFGKCQGLWNKTGRSHMAAETVEEECNLQFIRPNQTRWNSTYMAVERIIQIIHEKGEGAIRNVCEKFKVKM